MTEAATLEPGDAVLLVSAGGSERRVRLFSYLDAELTEFADRESNAWIKGLRHAIVDGRSFRDRFTYRGDSLWWFAELYFHKGRKINAIFQTILALETLIEQERPVSLTLVSSDRVAWTVIPRVAGRFKIACAIQGSPVDGTGRFAQLKTALRAAFYIRSTTFKAAFNRRAASDHPDGSPVGAFIHTAFWRSAAADDAYVGPVLRALADRLGPDGLTFVGLGPLTKYRTRDWQTRLQEFWSGSPESLTVIPVEQLATRESIRSSRAVWRARAANRRALLHSEDLRRHSVVRGVDCWPIVAEELSGVAYLQFPWSALAMDLAAAAFETTKPRVAVTYAEAGGWGRALLLEARRRHVPTVGLQHGFISRHWLNYLHEPDEVAPSAVNAADAGFPYPDRTLVYDGFAAHHLIEQGHLPERSLVVTGNPRLDELVARAGRMTEEDLARVRRDAGAQAGQHVVVLAIKYRNRYRATLEALLGAIAGMPDVHLAMKLHPADVAAPYEELARLAPNSSVVPAATSVVELTVAARLLVTVNSTAAIEAMVLGVPSMAVMLPNYLSPFVEAGVMAGTRAIDEVGPTLRALVLDEDRRTALARESAAFMTRFSMRSEGDAPMRAAQAVIELSKETSAAS